MTGLTNPKFDYDSIDKQEAAKLRYYGDGKSQTVQTESLDDWLLEASRFPGRIHMTSKIRQLHDYYVIVAPPRSRVIRVGKRNRPEKQAYSLSLLAAE